MCANRLRAQWDQLTGEELRRLQGAKLARFVREKVLPYSAYYQALFKKAGVSADQIRTLDDLQRIPISSKADLVPTDEQPDRPRDFVLAPEPEQLKRKPSVLLRGLLKGRSAVQKELAREYRPIFLTSTTGRSSRPVPFLYTRHDLDNLDAAGERLVDVLGADHEDRLINMFPYAPHLAFWQTHHAVKEFGVFTVSTGGGRVMGTDGNIRLMQRVKPQGLIGMPTFLYHLLRQAINDGVKMDSLNVLVLGGEKVPDGTRLKLSEMAAQLGSPDVRVVATYGFTEAKLAWGECRFPHDQPSGGYHLYPDLGLFEVVDPKTSEVQPEGHPGELVYTSLDARGSVVLRYRTGDVIEGGMVYEPCPYCGRRAPRLVGNIGRQSEVREMKLGKLKGTLIDFNKLEHLLDDLPQVETWQIELRKRFDDPMELDELVLHVVAQNDKDKTGLSDAVNKKCVESLEIRPNEIVFHNVSSMKERHGVGVALKEQRVLDHRAEPDRPAPPRTWTSAQEGAETPHE